MTRIQQERFTDPVEYEKVKNVYSLNASMLSGVRPNMKILHPLPRLQEIAVDTHGISNRLRTECTSVWPLSHTYSVKDRRKGNGKQ